MSKRQDWRLWGRLLVAAVLLVMASGCAMVKMRAVSTPDFTAAKRSDVLSSGKLGHATQEALQVIGLDPASCGRAQADCIAQMSQRPGVGSEARLAALAELWTQAALLASEAERKAGNTPGAAASPAAGEAWLEAARHAYAYLFFSGRSPAQRAMEDRQLQVRDYYNHAVEQLTASLFERAREQASAGGSGTRLQVAEQGWTITADYAALQLQSVPKAMMAASSISFAGLRSTYRRDGFGAELVVMMEPEQLVLPLAANEPEEGGRRTRDNIPVFSEMPAINATAVLRFAGATLEQVLATRELSLVVYPPERTASIEMEGNQVPLAANYTAAYGLWLANSGFAGESLRTLFGRSEGITQPHIYLMQPYDPDKRILFLLHGLASSPEAWVNLVNEVTGDPVLRDNYQVWSVYYPTNAPVGLNRYTISRALNRTLAHFDPQGSAVASRDMVFIGHSMGGILARLMLSTPGDSLMDAMMSDFRLDAQRRERVERRLGPVLRYQPQANVSRAIFIAAPHQGTDIAGNRLGRFIGKLVRLPLTILGGFADVVQLLADPNAVDEEQAAEKPRVPNSIDNLKASDPFIRAAARLPLRPGLPYHSIIARRDPQVPLEQSNDGLVPYWSAHLDGAQSEKVINSWHSVQETPEAVLEVRRILHQELAADGNLPGGLQPGQL